MLTPLRLPVAVGVLNGATTTINAREDTSMEYYRCLTLATPAVIRRHRQQPGLVILYDCSYRDACRHDARFCAYYPP